MKGMVLTRDRRLETATLEVSGIVALDQSSDPPGLYPVREEFQCNIYEEFKGTPLLAALAMTVATVLFGLQSHLLMGDPMIYWLLLASPIYWTWAARKAKPRYEQYMVILDGDAIPLLVEGEPYTHMVAAGVLGDAGPATVQDPDEMAATTLWRHKRFIDLIYERGKATSVLVKATKLRKEQHSMMGTLSWVLLLLALTIGIVAVVFILRSNGI